MTSKSNSLHFLKFPAFPLSFSVLPESPWGALWPLVQPTAVEMPQLPLVTHLPNWISSQQLLPSSYSLYPSMPVLKHFNCFWSKTQESPESSWKEKKKKNYVQMYRSLFFLLQLGLLFIPISFHKAFWIYKHCSNLSLLSKEENQTNKHPAGNVIPVGSLVTYTMACG